MIKVVHCNRERYDVFIGRRDARFHFGNPFTHLSYGLGSRKVRNRKEAIARFRSWLDGTSDKNVEPERRLWILKHLSTLEDKTLGCFCKPLACHGDVYADYGTPKRRDDNDKQGELPLSFG